MKKLRYLSIAALVCYVVFFLAGVLLATGMIKIFNDVGNNGLGAAVVAILSIIIAIIGFLYASFSVVPLILRSISIAKKKLAFYIICMPFDVIYILLNIGILASVMSNTGDSAVATILFAIFLLLVSVASLTLNILCIIFERKYKRESREIH